MALTPYRQQIGIPREAGGGVSDIVDTRVQDLSQSLDNVSKQLMAVAAPRLEEEAIRKAQANAGSIVLERDAEGKLIAPERTLEGGMVYQQAFDKVMAARYLSEVGGDFQKFLDNDAAARRDGSDLSKKFDAADYAKTVESYKQGMLEAVPAWLRAETEELFTREAGERIRAFGNEVSRERRIQFVNGTEALIDFHTKALTPAELDLEMKRTGKSRDELEAGHNQIIENLTVSMRQRGMTGDLEVEAEHLNRHRLSEGVDNYYAGRALIAQNITTFMEMDEAGLNAIDLGLDGIDITGGKGISGMVRTRTGAQERVTPELLEAATPQIFGFKANSTVRADDHPLSIANPHSKHKASNGGRAVDIPRVKGKSIEDAVAMWEAAGFEVTYFKDEYKDPSAHATGGHWHFEFANTREVVKEEAASVKLTLGIDDLATMDSSLKPVVRGIIADRRAAIRTEQAERRADIRSRAEIAAKQEEETKLLTDIQFRVENDLGGVYSTKEAQLIDSIALRDPNIDWSNLNSAQSRAGLVQHIRTYQRPPTAAISWMQNRIRSNEWAEAFELWDNIKASTVGKSNNRVGDLLLSKLDTRSRALFDYAESLHENRESVQTITDALGTAVTGDGFTPDQAKARYNAQLGKEGNKSPFEEDKKDRVANLLGLSGSERANLSQDMLDNIDASFAINYEILRDPEKALTASVRQTAKAYRRSALFTGGVGPASLADNYSRAQLAEFLVKERVEGGGFLLPILPGGRKHLLGVNVKFAPIGNQTDRIGEYRVRIMDPDNLAVELDSYTIDLGKYLPAYFRKEDPAVTVRNRERKLKEAGDRAAAGQDALTRMGQAADRGPKY
jgi:hypothetical protein